MSTMKTELPKNHFKKTILVAKDDIDGLNHVNNVVYLKWMIDVAIGHCEALGFTFDRFRELGGVFVVRRHEIDYIKSALLGDELTMYTWSEPMESSRALRIYQLMRESDQKLVLEGKTYWAFINPNTGRPTPIPVDITEAFAPN